jgi:hypothetical protein
MGYGTISFVYGWHNFRGACCLCFQSSCPFQGLLFLCSYCFKFCFLKLYCSCSLWFSLSHPFSLLSLLLSSWGKKHFPPKLWKPPTGLHDENHSMNTYIWFEHFVVVFNNWYQLKWLSTHSTVLFCHNTNILYTYWCSVLMLTGFFRVGVGILNWHCCGEIVCQHCRNVVSFTGYETNVNQN